MKLKSLVLLLFPALLLSQTINLKIKNSSENGFILTNDNDRGLFYFDKNINSNIELSDAIGAAYRASFSNDGRFIAYKYITLKDEISYQTPVLYDTRASKIIELASTSGQCGIPSFSSKNEIAYTTGKDLFILDNELKIKKHLSMPNYVNTPAISPDGNYVVINDTEGQLFVYDLVKDSQKQLTDGTKWYYDPIWSPDSKKIGFKSISSEIYIFDLEKKENIYLKRGNDLSWSENELYFIQTEYDNDAKLIYSQPSKYNFEEKTITKLGLTTTGKVTSLTVKNSQAYYTLENGNELCIEKLENSQNVTSLESKMIDLQISDKLNYIQSIPNQFKKVNSEKVIARFDSVYFNQVYDVRPDRSGIGSGCCGAASSLMGLMYYNLLPQWGTTCYNPYQHYSPYANYLSEIYTYKGVTYDISYARGSGSSSIGWGIYGWIYRNSLEDTKGHQAELLRNHGIASEVDWSPSYTKVKNEIDNSWPFVLLNSLTEAGHYIVWTGYVNENYIGIFNDPYGNRNYSSYLRYSNTTRVKYDWPGYNNGYANLNTVHCFIYMRGGCDLVFSSTQFNFNGDYKSPVKVEYKLINQGTKNLNAPFKIKLFLSADNKLDLADSMLYQKEYYRLDLNETLSENVDCYLPPTQSTKIYYIILKCDADDLITETSKSNNTAVFKTATIGKPNVDILYPLPNSIMTFTKCAIYVAFDTTQQIDTSTIILKVNNKDISSSMVKYSNRIIYYPPVPWADSIQNVSIYLRNKNGYDTTFNWQFKVVLPNKVNSTENLPDFKLYQNYPNPYNPETQIRFGIPQPCNVKISIYNNLGQEIEILLNEFKNPGEYTVNFNAEKYPSGTYYYRIYAGEFFQSRKMLYLK